MNFPLFHRPGTVVFLDDDPDYLEMLALVLPRHWHVKLFTRPSDCINYLQQEPPFWEADAWNQQQLIEQWRAGKPLVPQILEYWAKYTERYSLARVCVVDYSMPSMDGLEALSELVEWPGSRVLLTGQADEQIAVRAFNRGLIDQFIPKQSPDIARTLVSAVDHLLATPNARHAQTWRVTLSPEQNALLRMPSIGRELSAFAARQWIEHVALGDPFGVLGLDASGRASWLQLESRDGLAALAELADLEGVPPSSRDEIREGRSLANLELRQALGLQSPVQLAPAFPLGPDGQLFGAVFDIETRHGPGASNGFAGWLARQEARHVSL
ncbi:response regulator [Caenimonas aquaedulcis]|uniref:Response regulator n=1 Tax=Caenimonas aquaedulcis TaxID=2793270 RepID=A0A931MIE4_9BURK|nr:response regulator [Caenimonas aquaedulcis]MBG9389749.1 response regulator [Caenimonas aquaedulcis]